MPVGVGMTGVPGVGCSVPVATCIASECGCNWCWVHRCQKCKEIVEC